MMFLIHYYRYLLMQLFYSYISTLIIIQSQSTVFFFSPMDWNSIKVDKNKKSYSKNELNADSYWNQSTILHKLILYFFCSLILESLSVIILSLVLHIHPQLCIISAVSPPGKPLPILETLIISKLLFLKGKKYFRKC